MALTVPSADISEYGALTIIAGAARKAAEIGVPMCIAVCDTGGNLKSFLRMDGAALLSTQVAQDKAYTAVGGIDRLVIFGGGYPITIDGAVVGAVGVSGGHYSQDQEVAEAGLATLEAPDQPGG